MSLSSDRSDRTVERGTVPLLAIEFYDDPLVVEHYERVRRRPDAPHRTLEQPVVLSYLGDLRDKAVLDLGCGDAWLGRYAIERGAVRYLGIDGSATMLRMARATLRGTHGELQQHDLETWRGRASDRFDIVVSRLVLHHVRDVGSLLEAAYRHLGSGGLLVFSIEHPLVTASFDGEFDGDIARVWYVRDYFRETGRIDSWGEFRAGTGRVPDARRAVWKYHRTIESYVALLRRAGFRLDDFSEGRPEPGRFAEPTRYEQRLSVPLCAIFRCVRVGQEEETADRPVRARRAPRT